MSLPFTRDQFFDVLAAWFSPTGSVRHVFAWTLIIYGLLYPLLAQVEGHTFLEGPRSLFRAQRRSSRSDGSWPPMHRGRQRSLGFRWHRRSSVARPRRCSMCEN